MRSKGNAREGVTLLELILVIGIIGILLGLLLAGVMRVRDAAYRLESMNNIRQIALATHSFADAHRGRLPEVSLSEVHGGVIFPVRHRPSVFVELLPYIEQGNVYREFMRKPHSPPVVALFLSPADPTVPSALAERLPVSSYAVNAEVFQRRPNLTTKFADGTSNTIAFAEHYAFNCGGQTFYYASDRLPNSAMRRATFSDWNDVFPVTEGNPPVSRPDLDGFTFQVAPSRSNCYPHVAQTPHFGGMLVAMGDGSVRTLAPGMSSTIYWGAVTPAGGEILGNDW
jgi:type II secretory pathway pseudopilin PulG